MYFSSIAIALFSYGVISHSIDNMLTEESAGKNQAIATIEQAKQSQNLDSSTQKLIQCLRSVRNSRPNHNNSTISSNSRTVNQPTNPSTNNRAACVDCRTKYPAAARHQGIEGTVEVAIDTDAQGNVINVRLTRSSGNRELDEETLRQARNWKLKPESGGRQGVSVATEYAIRGTCRHKELQQRRRERS